MLLDDESRTLFTNRIRQQSAGRRTEEPMECRIRRKDGSHIYAALNITLNIDGSEPDRALVVAHDITARRRVEETLKEYTATLEAANKELEDLLLRTHTR